jgi:hypothetical protein
MKKLVLVLGLVALTVSCKKEDLSPSVEYSSSKDCDCDRIVKVFQYNVVNSAEEGGVSIYAHIWTVNDCSNFNKDTKRNFSNVSLVPKVGECYKMPY